MPVATTGKSDASRGGRRRSAPACRPIPRGRGREKLDFLPSPLAESDVKRWNFSRVLFPSMEQPTVLIVHAEEGIRALLVRMLASFGGYSVKTATSGEET